MLRTEDDAKRCWCPYARENMIVGFDGGRRSHIGNRNTTDQTYAKCIATNCMAWRWSYQFTHMETGKGTHYDPKLGYCGLAGSVQP